MDYYKQIFKRKSFHLFRDTGVITDQEIRELEEFIESVKPLYADIKTKIRVVPEDETTCKRGEQFCLLFYSERKEGYLQNIGYLGEQIDLYLASKNIGALWFRVYGLKFRVYGLGFRVCSLGWMVYGLGFVVYGLGFRVKGLWFGVEVLWFRV